jgi:signal transduction histidine kinase
MVRPLAGETSDAYEGVVVQISASQRIFRCKHNLQYFAQRRIRSTGRPPAARKALETGSGEVTGGGVGLRVIVDRTRSVGGTVRVESDPAGTSVTLAIPLLLTAGRAA